MKIKVVYNDWIPKSLSWFLEVGGITIYPRIILRKQYRDNPMLAKFTTPETIRHESIHIKQQGELLVIFFYVWYFVEWFLKLFVYGKKSYYNISFEREAHENDKDLDYLKNRKRFSFLKYFFKK